MEHRAIQSLKPFIGEWTLPAGGRTVFEWGPGEAFLVQRWEVPHPEIPDGVAVIEALPEEGRFRQHFFDSRGVARLYDMTFSDGVWSLSRTAPDFSPLDFHQRFEGRFTNDGDFISGRWESSPDGRVWNHDFDLDYRRRS